MPRYYCDYCDTYLTHDSPSVRKQHNAGYKHKANVRSYYQQFEAQQNQSLIDQKIKEHLGQAAAFQVGAAYNQMRPRLPVLPTPMMPMPGGGQIPMGSMMPGMRPPVLPRPMPGYAPIPGMPPMMAPPGAYPGQPPMNGLPRPPPTLNVPTSVPGTAGPPTSGAPSMGMYQPNPAAPAPAPANSGGGYDGFNTSGQAPAGDEASQ